MALTDKELEARGQALYEKLGGLSSEDARVVLTLLLRYKKVREEAGNVGPLRLLPCPFCEGQAETVQVRTREAYARSWKESVEAGCRVCGIRLPIDMWNKRMYPSYAPPITEVESE